MGRHEISGDWVVPTQTQMKELVDVIGELPLPIIDRLLREPAVRSLNFDMHYPSGGRNVCSLQIVDSPIDGDKIAFDEGTQSAVYLRLFTVEGRAAELEFTAYLWFSGENLHYSIGRPEGREAFHRAPERDQRDPRHRSAGGRGDRHPAAPVL